MACTIVNRDKLREKVFAYGLNYNIKSKVKILIPQTLHEIVHRDIISKEELASGGQMRYSRPIRSIEQRHGS